MRRPRSGLNVVRKQRPDGAIEEYLYYRKTKDFFGHDREVAPTKTLQDAATMATNAIHPGSAAELIVEYLTTPNIDHWHREPENHIEIISR